ncbi:peptide methionine sulfoxide reductase [Pelistega indica]|uniref:Peptide methionine sulfoxide reductase n=1 Tax=Pelistega indica TaxID=1414851 RepID=V8GAJ6_9BURK|nr:MULTISPECIES: YwqG family protein [Pelistega]ETD72717.1 peptide methionine sulfoxide reductase [Pelistega indica]
MYTLQDLKIAFENVGLTKLFEEMQHYAKNSIVIELNGESDEQVIGASRFGGDPDLPAELEWFNNEESGAPLNFVAQLNCADLTPFDQDNKLPTHGILYFFYDVDAFLWGFDQKDYVGSRVYFYDGSFENLETRPCPAGIKRFTPCTLTFSNQIDLPEYSSQLIQTTLSDDEYERYLDLQESLELVVDNKLLGHSNNIQNGMELQCELVRHGIYCGSSAAYHDPRVPELAPGRLDWQLLFQIASNEETDMKWGDDGNLYFWIRAEDLKAGRFDYAWQILQSY